MSQSLKCVVINPGDIDSYVSTVKQNLLYFDQIHLIPAFDVFHVGLVSMLTQVSNVASKATPEIIEGFHKLRHKMEGHAAGRGVSPSHRALKKVLGKKGPKIAEKCFIKRVDKGNILRGVEENAALENERIRRVEKQLSPAIQAGLITVQADHANVERFRDALLKAKDLELRKALAVCESELLGAPARESGGAEDALLRYSGEQAAVMTATYDCPLMTSSASFMRHLSLNMKSVPPSKWLSKDVVQKQWRESSLSLTVSDRELPTFDGLDIEDVLEVRRVVGDELGYYRLKLAEFAETLRSAPWDKDFQKEAKALLDSEIRPAIEAARVAFLQDPPFPYRIKKALKAAKSERRRLNQIAEFLPIPEPIIAWTGFCAGVDKYIEGCIIT